MAPGRSWTRRAARLRARAARVALAGVSALVLFGAALGPPVVAPVAAATDSLFEGSATYTVDPEAGATHVAIDVTFTARKRATATTIYYFDGFGLGVQPEATKIKVSDASGSLRFTTKHTDSFKKGDLVYFPGTEVRIDFRRNLFYGQKAKFRVTYDLAGVPRSASPVRVGEAFTTFPVWAYGDDRHAKVKVVLPAGFEPRVDGYPLNVATAEDGRTILTSEPPKPDSSWSLITAVRMDAYATKAVHVAPDVDVRLESFPEDTMWMDSVSDVLIRAGPRLRDLIGVPPAGDGPIVVRERYVLDLGTVNKLGFAPNGAWTADHSLGPRAVALDESTEAFDVLRQFVTAWFDGGTFANRWMNSGFAYEYAAQAVAALGGEAPQPDEPALADPGRQPLELWSFPRFPVGPDYRTAVPPVAQRETYGQNASWWVVHRLTEAAGSDRMRAVIARVANDQIAYGGGAPLETSAAADDWKRLLDLA